jgi:UDP-N-acetylmuramoyl-tripeptide--D-alanyl-D-alanine ligase
MNGHPLSVLARVPGVRPVGQWPETCARVHTDTRSLQAQDCFVALRGERFDAHQFLPQLHDLGVQCALAEHGLAASGLSGAEVDDSRRALGDWAGLWRAQLKLPLIAVTGSNGKTTVTQMIASILRAAAGDAALATEGNFNNDIGVPLTLLRLRPEHRIAVVELGMNHPGEIAGLARMAQAQVAVVNNAQREHQEFMGSVEAVARENAAVFEALPADGTAIFPLHSPFAGLWRELASSPHATRRCWTFALNDASADVWAEAQWHDSAWALRVHSPLGSIDTTLAMAGEHNALNALAAAACALAAGVTPEAVAQGLRAFQAVAGRSRLLHLERDSGPLSLIDDSYNANPDSVLAAIAVLQSLPEPRALVLGDMGEVGQQGLAFHQEVLQAALAADIAHIDVCGEWMQQAVAHSATSTRLRHWDSVEALLEVARERYALSRSVLIKGSRFMRMERVVKALTDTKGQVHAA